MRGLQLSALLWSLAIFAQAPDDMPGRMALKDPATCAPCHPEDAAARWTSHRERPCTAYCHTCHLAVDMANHHAVDSLLRKPLNAKLPLTTGHRTACFTCHTLAQTRYDRVRWKAESLFGRLFRREPRQKTYFLVTRNDRGQLCRACH
jgi:hypothetical protein